MIQYKDKKLKILSFGSSTLANTEQKCHNSKLELLSLKWVASETI